MATTADFKNGMCLDIDGQYFFIVEFLHVKPGKGPAFVRTKLKNVTTGRILDKTWNSGVKVQEVRIERRPYQFLYRDDMGCNLMNNETFERVLNVLPQAHLTSASAYSGCIPSFITFHLLSIFFIYIKFYNFQIMP